MAARATVPPFGRSVVHLWVLAGFALAQPIFDLLGRNAAFFAVRGSTSRDIILFAVALVVVPSAALAAVEGLARLGGERVRAPVHVLLVAALIGVIALPVVKHHVHASTDAILAVAAAIGAAGAALYVLSAFGRSLLTLLAPAPLVFLALFLFNTPVKELAFPSEAHAATAAVRADTPVVVVIFDEFPVASLMDRSGRVDPTLYPHFADLARHSTWFRNTTTVSPSTTYAVPAILTGLRGDRHLLPVYADHPHNIFTLLGGRYRLNVFESETHLCPQNLCAPKTAPGEADQNSPSSLTSDVGYIYLHVIAPPAVAATLPPVSSTWGNFAAEASTSPADHASAVKAFAGGRRARQEAFDDRAGLFERFVRSIRSATRTLHLIHVELPHAPWQYLPDGRQYALGRGVIPGRDGDRWGHDATLVNEAHARHLLQVGFVDRLLGQLMAKLRRTGMWDRSLVIVTADHGISFRPGDDRRAVTSTNLQDIAFPPLFIKRPGQQKGQIDDHHVQTIDILPTIADVIGAHIPWHVDGHSVYSGWTTDRVAVGSQHGSDRALLRLRAAALQEKIRTFGDGSGGPGVLGYGPDPAIVGKPLEAVAQGAPAEETATLDPHTRDLVTHLPRNSPYVPSPIEADVSGGDAVLGRPVAVVVNGRIVATTNVYSAFGRSQFAALVPETAFHPGRNAVSAYWIVGRGAGLRLERLANLA